MTQKKMIQLVTRRQQEEMWHDIERKDCGLKEETGHFLSLDQYKIKTILRADI
jgi:hypothetical protein